MCALTGTDVGNSIFGTHGYRLGVTSLEDYPVSYVEQEGEDWRVVGHEHGGVVSFFSFFFFKFSFLTFLLLTNRKPAPALPPLPKSPSSKPLISLISVSFCLFQNDKTSEARSNCCFFF